MYNLQNHSAELRRSITVILPIVVMYIAVYIGFSVAFSRGDTTAISAYWLQQSLLFVPERSSLWAYLPQVQNYWMFLTYSFVHTSVSHLLMNVVFLIVLGYVVMSRVDRIGFLIIYVGAIIAGALAFALSNPSSPMAGSSGGIYGLAGAILYWSWADYPGQMRRYYITGGDAFLMILSNVVYYYVSDGAVAWQAHLGGCVAGFFYASLQHNKETRKENAA